MDAAISVVLVVHNECGLTRACVASLGPTSVPFELCVVDNASTDETPRLIEALGRERPVRYERNAENVGLIRALNQGARLAGGEFLCFLHNDTEMRDPEWLERLHRAVVEGERVGLAGLYGVRRIRRDGRYVGRTIVHALAGRGTLDRPVVEVAAVDGVCLFVRRAVLDAIGGFDERYGFFHGYDRDISFAVREAGWRCVVVDAPFVHHGGGTRTAARSPLAADEDLVHRREALARFAAKWGHRLPCDVRTPGERVLEAVRPLLRRPGRPAGAGDGRPHPPPR